MSNSRRFRSLLNKYIYVNSSEGVFPLRSGELQSLRLGDFGGKMVHLDGFDYQVFNSDSDEYPYVLAKGIVPVDDVIATLNLADGLATIGGQKYRVFLFDKGSIQKGLTLTPEELEDIGRRHDAFVSSRMAPAGAPPEGELSIGEAMVKVESDLKGLYGSRAHSSPTGGDGHIGNITAPRRGLEVAPQDEEVSPEPSPSLAVSELNPIPGDDAGSRVEVREIHDGGLDGPEYQRPIGLPSNPAFWFSLDSSLKNTDLFWRDVRNFYDTHPRDLRGKLREYFSRLNAKPTVFGRIDDQLRQPSLNDSLSVKINSKIQDLKGKQKDLLMRLSDLEKTLQSRGIFPDSNEKFLELTREEAEITETLAQAKHNLFICERIISESERDNRDLKRRFYLDIHGDPQLISEYQILISEKLMHLNMEVNRVHEKHLNLEQNILKRLKSIEDAKMAYVKAQIIDQEHFLERYARENEEFLETIRGSKRREYLRHMGDLHEGAAQVQERLEEEQNKAQYYMDNLRGVPEYENYEEALLNHRRDMALFYRRRDDFNRRFFKLKSIVQRKERKFNLFFDEVECTLGEFQREVVESYTLNDRLVHECVQVWWDRWNREAIPTINTLFNRRAKIVESFSPIPGAQVSKLYRSKLRLLDDAKRRQSEWDRILGEIEDEFRSLGYELPVPGKSELEERYLEQLDTSSLSLSRETRSMLFLPDNSFSLVDGKNNLIGLDPKLLDDDNFLVIDQVWSTLTREQEEKLRATMDERERRRRGKETRKIYKLLLKDQFNNLGRRYVANQQPLDSEIRDFSESEKREKFTTIEDLQMQIWNADNRRSSVARGEFKDTLYSLSRKLFLTKSVRIANSEIVLSDTGFVEDNNTEIFTDKDYFIKTPLRLEEPDVGIEPRAEETDLYQTSDEDYINLIDNMDFSYFADRFDPESDRPPLEDRIRRTLEKYQAEPKTYELEVLREKLYYLSDEVRKVEKFHSEQKEHLERVLSERAELFDEMQRELNTLKGFLSEKEQELDDIFTETGRELDISFQEIEKNIQSASRDAVSSSYVSTFFDRIFGGK